MHEQSHNTQPATPATGLVAVSSGPRWWLGDLPARILGIISCIALFAMMLVTFIDVLGRYFFASPLPAAYELISLIMPAIIFCALPMVNLTEGHVTIDLLDSMVPKAIQRWQSFLVNLIAAGALAMIAWRLFVLSQDHHEFDGVTDELYLPLWPFSAAMGVLCVIAAITMIVAATNRLSDAPTSRTGADL